MRKFLTFGLFLAILCIASASFGRGKFPVTQVGGFREGLPSHGDSFPALREKIWKSPIRWPEIQVPPYLTSDTVSVVFLGDMMMHSGQIANAKVGEDSFDFSLCFPRVERLIKEADIAVANMEFTLAGRPYTGYPCFSAPDSYAETIAEIGVDIFLTANNHILDKGRKGIERTLGEYSKLEEERRVRYTGTAMTAFDDSLRFPLRVVSKGIRIAMINFTYGTNCRIGEEYPMVYRTDTVRIAEAVRRARAFGADFIIALPHWGVEYSLRHSAAQERLARWLAEKGCDAVIGAHPHVLQDIETLTVEDFSGARVRNVPVVYSLGNFISNMSAPNTQIGMMVTLRFTKDALGNRNMLEPLLTLTWCSRPGNLTKGYTTIPVKNYVGRRDQWLNPCEYDKMMATYNRVKKETGIKD